jgi:flavodoxin
MNVTIVYDSVFGNTAKVATAIAGALEHDNSVRLTSVRDANNLDLAGVDLLIVGSPTRGFRPTPQISEFLAGLHNAHEGLRAAAFDTRIDLETVHPAPLRWVMEAGGYAAARMDEMLRDHGFAESGEFAGFLVTGTEGPLKAGEIERATEWARNLMH